MKVLLLGKMGQIGHEIVRSVQSDWRLTSLGRSELDLVDGNKIRKIIRKISPQIIVNAAAYTRVDKAESSQELALKVNADAVQVMIEEANRIKATLIHYSTDYVFDGSKSGPYLETDTPNPINFYGLSKLKGENAIITTGESYIILRTSWVYSNRGQNFLTKIMDLSRKTDVIQVVEDQFGCPTWSRDIADATIKLIASSNGVVYDYFKLKRGLYHFCSKGYISRYIWAQEIIKLDPNKVHNKTIRIVPTVTSNVGSAKRPKNSALSCQLFEDSFMIKTPMWKNSLRKMMSNETKFFYEM